MLRPEQMSRVSVTGSKSVMDDVIETMHDLHLIHITDYDGSWDGFEPGDSLEGADETSSKLVTVRAIESILGIDEDDFGPAGSVTLENADERLEEIREEVNELDDRRDELRNRLRSIDERLSQMELFADLGLDLGLLWGYDSIEVLVGEGSSGEIDAALADAEGIEASEVFGGSKSFAAFAKTAEDTEIEDALVGVQYSTVEVPEKSGDPQSNTEQLKHEREQVETELETVETELETLKLDSAGFILALEEKLTIEAQKSEAPLRFATTERSFIVEGWIPTSTYDEFVESLEGTVGDSLEIAELERAQFTSHGKTHHEEVEHEEHDKRSADPEEGKAATDGGSKEESAADDADREVMTDGGESEATDEKGEARTEGGDEAQAEDGQEARTDGGVVTVEDDPPVIQKNSKMVNPFEVLVKAVNRPLYWEFDPTVTLFITFPLFFGFMIGDIGYGTLYVLIGYWVYNSFEKESVSNFGAVVAWLGIATIIFGFLYGEVFGLHFLEWYDIHPVMEKGLSAREWAIGWVVMATVAGWAHLNVGYVFNFVEELQLHGAKEAIIESGSWLLMLNGIWVWIFSHHTAGPKPEFLFTVFDGEPFPFAFAGFSETIGILGLVAYGLGILLIAYGPTYELAEFLVPVVHTLSYTRLTAVLLSKAGMALAVNLLYFGAYQDEEGAYHYLHSKAPEAVEHGEVILPGFFNMGIGGAILGIPVLLIGHMVVLAIGGTAALQAVRLEYVEFFEKFYEGGGKNYEPFGHEQTYLDEN